jgi:hypothetical protein
MLLTWPLDFSRKDICLIYQSGTGRRDVKRGAAVGFIIVLMLLMSVFPQSILAAHAVPDVATAIVASSKNVVGQGYTPNVASTRAPKGFGLFVYCPDAASAARTERPYGYMTDQDWVKWNAWNAKNIYSDNTLWLDVSCFLAWQTEWAALVARLVAGNIKYIYLQCCRFLDDHTILDFYLSWGRPRTLVQGFVDYVHANSNIKVLAWGTASDPPTVSYTTSSQRQQMVNAISAFVQSYGFDGYFDDTEGLGSNSPQNMVDYWNLIGTTMKSIGKVSAAALCIWHITDVGRYVTTLDWMELMDYFVLPIDMPEFINYMESALTYSASPVVWGVYAYDTNPDGTFTLTEQEAAIDSYLGVHAHDPGIALPISDDFETSNFSGWTGTFGSPTIQSSIVHCGTYAMNSTLTTSINAAGCYWSFEGVSSIYTRAYYYFNTLPPSGNTVAFMDSANATTGPTKNDIECVIMTNATNSYWGIFEPNAGSTFYSSTAHPSAQTWYCIGLYVNLSGTTQYGQLFVDNASVVAASWAGDGNLWKYTNFGDWLRVGSFSEVIYVDGCEASCAYAPLVGDITGPNGWPDGKVNILDIALVAKSFGTDPSKPLWNSKADINGDGRIDMLDISTVAKHFDR